MQITWFPLKVRSLGPSPLPTLQLVRDGRRMINDLANPISIVVRRYRRHSNDGLKRIEDGALAMAKGSNDL
jgi:hypothetical protein